jgi:MerR family copper efflux transcriptional regulator
MVMTVGGLSRRTGVPVKTLREYEDMGLIYTVGRSAGNYRLFDEEALWCVGLIGALRGLGLTLAEIRGLAEIYLRQPGEPIGPRLAESLQVVRVRTRNRIAELGELLQRIDEFEADHAEELAGHADFRAQDPRYGQPA